MTELNEKSGDSKNDKISIIPSRLGSMQDTEVIEARLKRDFGLWSLIAVSWNMVNVFGGLSYIFVVGFSAGGLPTILYGFIGASACVACMQGTLAECAAVFPTAGGAYHFATFLVPAKYRRQIAYPIGWMSYLGWVLTIAACCSIAAGLTMSLVILCKPEFEVGGRYQLFLLYVAWAALAWLLNIYMIGAVPLIENVACWTSLGAFIAFFITLLALAPKPDPAFIFKTVTNETGYSSDAMAIVLGLYNSMVALLCLDSPCHLAEEVPNPKKLIPKILWLTIIVQFVVGTVWILVIGFSITDIDTIINSPTGVPIIEVVRQGLNSNAAAIVFNVFLLLNYIAATIGATITTSRQGFALARDGGLFFTRFLTRIDPKFNVPVGSVHLAFVLTLLCGLVFLGSSTGFNALLGAEAAFMILSFAAPALMMLIFGRAQLPKSSYNLGKVGYICCIVTVVYALAVFVLVMIPSIQPVDSTNFNYTILIVGTFSILMVVVWFADATRTYKPPSFTEFVDRFVTNMDKAAFIGNVGGDDVSNP